MDPDLTQFSPQSIRFVRDLARSRNDADLDAAI